MNALTPIVAQLDEETSARVRELARLQGISDSEFVADAIRRIAESDTAFRAFVQEGIDAADRGGVVTQEEMERWYEERIADRRTA